MIDFKIKSEEGRARTGTLEVDDRKADTPFFMPVATKASVKTLLSEDLKEMGYEALISNMYHLLMRPGVDIIEDAGGLHEFMNWDGIIFTDSGGFQMIRKGFDKDIGHDGVSFKSDIDGKEYHLTPEKCVELQIRLGTDVAMCLDHCPHHDSDIDTIEGSVERTTRWAKRCRQTHENVFAISQGGVVPELREKSCKELVDLDFTGYAIGGLSIGEAKEDMYSMIDICDRIYPDDKPRYFMGLGSPVDILEAVERGVDIFDSAYPTRNARHGTVFTSEGKVNIGNGQYKDKDEPMDPNCDCPICKNYNSSYINHLYRSDELSWMRMTSIHNLFFMNRLMENIRLSIQQDDFNTFKQNFIEEYK
ncbi:MAG: tRNA guanosine(34) transglycosylase Tgt [Thermoplasmatota archaeon]